MTPKQPSARALSLILLGMCAATMSAAAQDPGALSEQAGNLLDRISKNQPKQQSNADISVSQQGVIEMHVKNGDLYTVLQKLLLKTRTNMVISPEVQGAVTVSLYNVTLEEALESILRQNNAGFRREGNFVYIHTLEQLATMDAVQQPLVVRTLWLNYIAPVHAQQLLTPFLSEQGTITLGPAAEVGLSEDTGGQGFAAEDIIVVKDYEDHVEQVVDQLSVIDRRPKQVLLEATIIAADLNESNQLGIDFNVLGGVDFQLLAGSPSLLNAPNGASGAVGGGVGGNPGGGLAGPGTGGSDFGRMTPTVPVSRLNDTTYSFSTDFAASVPQGGISIGFVTDEVSAFLRALESVTNTTILANPKVLALNKQVGRLLIGSRDGYRTLTTTETTTTQNVEFLESGIRLTFRPFISTDGYVRLEVNPSDSEGNVNAQGLPSERTTEITSNIQIKDGHTVFIGGLFREFDTTGRSQVPGLGSVPFLGSLMGSSADATIRQEIIILLTVHIIEDDEPYAAYSEEMLDDMERLRVGLRDSMQWFGRSRLAQSNFEKALKYAAEQENTKALWHLNLAIHNRPAFIEAIKVRERLLQERSWDADGSLLRGFLHDVMLREKGLPDQIPFGRPDLNAVQQPEPRAVAIGYEFGAEDECPDDPDKVEPGQCGCGIRDADRDDDGTADCVDLCPDDVDKIEPGECGCDQSDVDVDGDGTVDCAAFVMPDPALSCAMDGDRLDEACPAALEDDCTPEPETIEDADDDGVEDHNDGCPMDPAKVDPGQCGCGWPDDDHDGDGVASCPVAVFGSRPDLCPEDGTKLVPGMCGCGVPDVDANHDGTVDCLEQTALDEETP
jgi:type IV pilus assembly protein PilQ